MDKLLPSGKIIITSTFIKNYYNNYKTEKIINMIVDMLKKVNK